jgi:hypothetical protein
MEMVSDLAPAADVQLAEQVVYMRFRVRQVDIQSTGDLFVAQPASD